jgi:hypothetical protein
MAQGVLPFQYEKEKNDTGMTSLAGLPTYLDLAHVMGLSDSIRKHINVRSESSQGWTDVQLVMSLILLNLAGGDCVDDLRIIEGDKGFCNVLYRMETHRLPRKERRALERRWRKERKRVVPSQSPVFRYLECFHDQEQEKFRQPEKAFIPKFNKHLKGFPKVNGDLVESAQKCNPQKTATLDMDATLIETNKADALYCYKGFKSYQPLNTWWDEQGIMLHTEFRDGNVPAGFEQLRVFEEALSLLPEGVEKVRLRSDTAAYQHNLLWYCEMKENKRFGRIEFAISSDVTPAFKEAVAEVKESEWKPIRKKVKGKLEKTGQEWAEVCFVPNAIAHSKKGPEYRYLAIREAMPQSTLPGMEKQLKLPFPVMKMQKQDYKVFGTVTNMDWEGEELIHWQRKRCGKSEEVNGIMKSDFAGGKLPSNDFGENAAWWWIATLALNLNETMKRLVLGKSWVSKQMKAMRFALINLPGKVSICSQRLVVRLSKNHPSFDWLIEIRRKIASLMPLPSG